MATRRLTAVPVMHCLSVKFRAVLSRTLTARGEIPVVAPAIVEMMVDVSVEAIRAMKPWACTDEDTA
jgi:hypothetical protein